MEKYKNQVEKIKELIIDKNQEGIIVDGKKTYGKYVSCIMGYIYKVGLRIVKKLDSDYYFIELIGVNMLNEMTKMEEKNG